MNIREREVDVLKSSGYLTTYSMLTLTCIPFMVRFIKIFILARLSVVFPVALVAHNVCSQTLPHSILKRLLTQYI